MTETPLPIEHTDAAGVVSGAQGSTPAEVLENAAVYTALGNTAMIVRQALGATSAVSVMIYERLAALARSRVACLEGILEDRAVDAWLKTLERNTREMSDLDRDLKAMTLPADHLAYAVWMVGNMDTVHDKRAWWRDHTQLWELAGDRMAVLRDAGVEVGQGFDRFKETLK